MLKRVLIAFFAILLFAVLCLYVFLSLNGPRLFNEQVSMLTSRKVSITSIKPILPVGVVLKGLSVDRLLTVERVKVVVDPLALMKGRFRIISVDLQAPVLFLERGIDAGLGAQSPSENSVGAAGGQEALPVKFLAEASSVKPAVKTGPVILHELTVRNGEVRLKDIKSGREWHLNRVKGNARDIPLTGESMRTEFLLTASLEQLDIPFIGHFAKAKGWVNWAAKDMDASLQAMDDDGRIGLNVNLLAKANDLEAKGHLRLVPSQQKQASGKKSGMVEDTVLGLLDAVTTDIDADFSFKTLMDHFDISRIALSGKVSSNIDPGKKFGNIVDDIRAVGEGLLKNK